MLQWCGGLSGWFNNMSGTEDGGAHCSSRVYDWMMVWWSVMMGLELLAGAVECKNGVVECKCSVMASEDGAVGCENVVVDCEDDVIDCGDIVECEEDGWIW